MRTCGEQMNYWVNMYYWYEHGMSMLRTAMPQTRGNANPFLRQSQTNGCLLWFKYRCLWTIYLLLKPVCVETINGSFPLLHDCYLIVLPYSTSYWNVLTFLLLIHAVYNKLMEFLGCSWYISISMQGLPDPSFYVQVSVILFIPSSP